MPLAIWILDIIPITSSSDKSDNFLSHPIWAQTLAKIFNGLLSDIFHSPQDKIERQI